MPLKFVVEDNGLSTNTPTMETWGNTREAIREGIVRYEYEREWPHHGTGQWILF